MTLEYKAVKMKEKGKVKSDDDFYYVEGYASTFDNIDHNGDIVRKGAYSRTIEQMVPKFLWQHNSYEPIGAIYNSYEDDKGLYIKAKMPKEDTFVTSRVIPQIKIGAIDSYSVGFRADEIDYIDTQDGLIREVKQITLGEVSLVTFPANTKAVMTYKSVNAVADIPFISSDKSGVVDQDWTPTEAKSRIVEYVKSNNTPESEYSKYFLVKTDNKINDIKAYSMPVVDIVDGNPVICVKSLYYWASVVKGSKDTDISKEEKNRVEHTLSMYFKKADRENPIKKSFVDYIESFNNIKDYSTFLKSYGLSNKEATAFISCVKKHSQEKDQLAEKEKAELDYVSNEIKQILKSML